ncbi:hypothetical protein [Halodurantibacterium flavum]|uniref:Transcriptional regulator n=1 Tax=Halodurantibacterium flavum TaxID=1382802 RepID=A0ABW4S967_9RHOB
MEGPVEIARASWGADIPAWVLRLAEECARSSQNKVAAQMNRSASLVSAVLRAKYKGDLDAVSEVVLGVFGGATVDCPALGTVPANLCRDWRARSTRFENVNALRVRMYRACNSCPRNRKEA